MNLGGSELAIILLIAVLIFGGAKIPDLARSLGSAKKEFEDGVSEGRPAEPKPADEVETPVADPAGPEAGAETAEAQDPTSDQP